MAKGIFEVAQELLADEQPQLPPNVSNRLLMATIITVRDGLKEDINGNSGRIEKQEEKIYDLEKSDKRWGAVSIVIAAVGSTIAAAIGIDK